MFIYINLFYKYIYTHKYIISKMIYHIIKLYNIESILYNF